MIVDVSVVVDVSAGVVVIVDVLLLMIFQELCDCGSLFVEIFLEQFCDWDVLLL